MAHRRSALRMLILIYQYTQERPRVKLSFASTPISAPIPLSASVIPGLPLRCVLW